MNVRSSIAGAFRLCIMLIFGVACSALATDLTQRYRATLDFSDQSQGYEWSTGPQDVWRLKEFGYALGDAFRIRLGPSHVVFGCHESNVVWAAVFPDQPGEIVAAPQGKGEHVTSIWLRFHPARLGELFPERIVAGQGDPAMLPRAKRLAAHKMRSCWQSGGLPMIPWKESVTFDVEAREGPRRFYSLHTDTGKVDYWDAFRARPLPAPKPLDSKTALEVFDKVWSDFDRQYAMFVIKPQVDWAKLRETYRPRAARAKTNHDLATVVSEMLDHLEDLHVYVEVDGQYVPGYNRSRPLNANPKALPRVIGKITSTGHDLDWGRTGDGIGYLNIHQLSDDALPDAFDEVLDQMADTKGLILDLRFNGGGSEPLGCQIAGRLLDRPRVYSLSQFRSGPKHTDLDPKNERTCGPAGPWHYVGSVVVLQGQKTMSSAESFALALAQCPQVTTLGDRTAGSSGNPTSVDAGAGIVVNLPQWIDMDPQGKPIDAVGVAPRVKIEAKAEDFSGDRDPVLAAGLEYLRKRIKTEKPPAGGVLQRRPGVPGPKDRPKVVSVSPAPDATGVDPVTEIRIRFDRPMDPNSMFLAADRENAGNVFRLRGSPRYLPETSEFVIPVLLRPGVRYRFSFPMFPSRLDGFWSSDGIAAAAYSWQFSTRAPSPAAKTPPRVVSVDPLSGAKTGVVTSIRVCFDRPMDPRACEVAGSLTRAKGKPEPSRYAVSAPFPFEYDATLHRFTFHTLLAGDAKARIELRGFRGADGGEAEPVTVEYQVGRQLYIPEQEARIAEAGRSAKLREVVEAVRRNRLAIKSLEELVRESNVYDDLQERAKWEDHISMSYGRFGFEGDRRFYADITGISRSPSFICFRVGSDGQDCWCYSAYRPPDSTREKKEVWFRPYDAVRLKIVSMADPFGSKRFTSTESAITALKLEYLGLVKREGTTCHRIRSWAGSIFDEEDLVAGFYDWLIDARSLLPVVCDAYSSGTAARYEFLHSRINEPVAPEAFRAPAGADIERTRCDLEEGYDYFTWRACDGSDGTMHAGYGQGGPKGGKGDGM